MIGYFVQELRSDSYHTRHGIELTRGDMIREVSYDTINGINNNPDIHSDMWEPYYRKSETYKDEWDGIVPSCPVVGDYRYDCIMHFRSDIPINDPLTDVIMDPPAYEYRDRPANDPKNAWRILVVNTDSKAMEVRMSYMIRDYITHHGTIDIAEMNKEMMANGCW